MKLINILTKYKWHLSAIILFAGSLYAYNNYSTTTEETLASFYVVDTVARGEVTSGIETTGEIIAAQKLDIDVYKKLSRIDTVNVQNGSHVESGEVLLSFDKNDAYVDAQSSLVSVAEAELSLETEQKSAADPNAEIRTLENQIIGYQKAITDNTQDIGDAYIDFLNTDLEIIPTPARYSQQADRTYPTLSGRYVSKTEGVYTIEVYASGAESGYSFRVTGLENITDSVIFGKEIDLGTRGLKITFPASTKNGDAWLINIANTKIASYVENKQDYEARVADLQKLIADARVNLTNAQQSLEELKRTDSTTYRDLSVQKAQASLQDAKVRLSQNYDVVQERDIVAPFSGTVEGMENVVEGATPTGGTSDTINLGTLISDEFLTTFTLSATDIAKVVVGQKVKVTVTSFTEQPIFEGTITEISSLPESTGVAKYEVRALLSYDRTSAKLILREGMLADIEVVEKENLNALRIPTAAITYEQGVPKATVINTLTEEQKQQVSDMGIVRTSGAPIETYKVTLKLGIVGQYYAEVLEGLDEGDIIVATSVSEESSNSVVEQAGFGPGRNSDQEPQRAVPAE
jgi:multidrug efflux pump subunit AcrA (membrane-fusion protein)